jgi:hypothetical protein
VAGWPGGPPIARTHGRGRCRGLPRDRWSLPVLNPRNQTHGIHQVGRPGDRSARRSSQRGPVLCPGHGAPARCCHHRTRWSAHKVRLSASRLRRLEEEKEAAEGRADALEEALDAAQTADDNNRIDTAELDKLVVARLATLQKLAPAFSEDFKFDGIDDADLYAQAFENLTGSAPREDADPAYIQGLVEGILTARADSEDSEASEDDEDEEDDSEDLHNDRADSTDALRRSLRGAGRSSTRSDAANTYRTQVLEAWKRPLTATK